MKKIILLAIGGVLFSNQVNAQLQKGDVYTNIGVSAQYAHMYKAGYLNTGFHYMIKDKLSLGLNVLPSYSVKKNNFTGDIDKEFRLSLAPQITYFHSLSDRFLLSGYASNNFGIVKTYNYLVDLNAGLGLDYFVTPKVSLGLDFNLFNLYVDKKYTGFVLHSTVSPTLSFKWKIFDASKKQKE